MMNILPILYNLKNMNNTIYEVRAYIGRTNLFYAQIFATLDAAIQRAMTLRSNYSDETPITGTINRLDLKDETYEFVELVCYL